jgi:dsRNA-specific ribonuclease
MKKFTVGVYLGNKKIGGGHGLSKKEAEQNAAKKGLEKLAKMNKQNLDFFHKLEGK